MIEELKPIALQDLRALAAPRAWSVEGRLEALPSLTPVRGEISAEHRGNVLAVEGSLDTIVTLTCDRCLRQFNQRLRSRSSELIWLGNAPPSDEEMQESEEISIIDGLVECLDPRGAFDPEQWAFEQLNLQLPVVNHCGDQCPGPASLHSSEEDRNAEDKAKADPRWNALRKLRNE